VSPHTHTIASSRVHTGFGLAAGVIVSPIRKGRARLLFEFDWQPRPVEFVLRDASGRSISFDYRVHDHAFAQLAGLQLRRGSGASPIVMVGVGEVIRQYREHFVSHYALAPADSLRSKSVIEVAFIAGLDVPLGRSRRGPVFRLRARSTLAGRYDDVAMGWTLLPGLLMRF
jgi:hypothetical protein